MHYPAHLANLLAMQKDASDRPAPGQQGLKDTSITVSPRTLPYYPGAGPNPGRQEAAPIRPVLPGGLPGGYGGPGAPDNYDRIMANENARRMAWARARLAERSGRTPGAGPAPGQKMPGKFYTDFGEQMPSVPRKTLRRYPPMGRTPPQQSPAPMRDVDERMPTPRAIPFERMERLPPRRRDSY